MKRDVLWCLVAATGLPATVFGQCNRPVGSDLIMTGIGGVQNYVADGTRDAFSVGADQTSVGNAPINYFGSTAAHPVTGQGLFRLRTVEFGTRFEQVGQSWLFHGFSALQSGGVCTCQSGGVNQLGIGCTSTDTANRTGTQTGLGPRWQVNPRTGVFVFPPANPPFSGSIARRLQARLDELDTTSAYFVEVACIAADDATAGNGGNNVSYRPCSLSGGPADFAMSLTGITVPEAAAITAWKAADPEVMQSGAPVVGDGWFLVSSRASGVIAKGWVRYEYAVYNLNVESGAGSFRVPVSDEVSISNIGFHDVDYSDGDGVGGVTRDGEDWRATRVPGAIVWETTSFAANPNGNGLLWGTLYNFRLDALVGPGSGQVTLGLWRQSGSVTAPAQVPFFCPANCDGSTAPPVLNVNDFTCFINTFGAGNTSANCDRSTIPPVLNVNDFVCFMARYAAGCS